jgi:branched-chain amino acid transport system ATP-binding protein
MNDPGTLLTLDKVVAGYGKMTILNGVTASIRKAAITTVVGPNGAGKSTMFKAIFGLLPIRSGSILLDGAATTNLPPRQMLAAGVWSSAASLCLTAPNL